VPAFGGLPVAAVPANLLAAPVAGPIMMWGMAAGLVAGWAGPTVARLIHLPTDLMIRWVAGVAHRGAAMPLGHLRAGHVVALAVALVLGVGAHRHRWRAGVAVAGLAAGAVALAPAVAVLHPSAVDGGNLVAGARMWRSGGATVVVVDDLKASPEAFLSALHQADVSRLDVFVVTRPGPAASSDVAAVLGRFPPRMLLAPAGNRLAGAVTVPPDAARIDAGGLVVTLNLDGPRLAVAVGRARAQVPVQDG
jgi:competence protein ComEC